MPVWLRPCEAAEGFERPRHSRRDGTRASRHSRGEAAAPLRPPKLERHSRGDALERSCRTPLKLRRALLARRSSLVVLTHDFAQHDRSCRPCGKTAQTAQDALERSHGTPLKLELELHATMLQGDGRRCSTSAGKGDNAACIIACSKARHAQREGMRRWCRAHGCWEGTGRKRGGAGRGRLLCGICVQQQSASPRESTSGVLPG